MKKFVFHLCLMFLLGAPWSVYGAQSGSEPVLILYNDSTGTIDLNNKETQPKPNRIIYYILNVILPEKYGIDIEMKPIIWSRGLDLVRTGLADGIIDASYNNERATYAVYPMQDGKPDPERMLRNVSYSLFKHTNSTINWDGKRLEGVDGDIVSVSSFAIVKDLRNMGVKVREEPNFTWIMRNLSLGKFKAAALQDYMANEHLAANPDFKNTIIKLEPPLKQKEYYLIYSRKFYSENKELAKAIWAAIADYKSTEDYRRKKREFLK